MDFDEQLELGHLLLNDRKCKSCGKTKNLVDDFYRTRKDRGCLLYTSPSPRDQRGSRMPSSA